MCVEDCVRCIYIFYVDELILMHAHKCVRIFILAKIAASEYYAYELVLILMTL